MWGRRAGPNPGHFSFPTLSYSPLNEALPLVRYFPNHVLPCSPCLVGKRKKKRKERKGRRKGKKRKKKRMSPDIREPGRDRVSRIKGPNARASGIRKYSSYQPQRQAKLLPSLFALTKANHMIKAVGGDGTRARTWEILPTEGHHCNSSCINISKWKDICHGQQWSPLESRLIHCFIPLPYFALLSYGFSYFQQWICIIFVIRTKPKLINKINTTVFHKLPQKLKRRRGFSCKWFMPPRGNQP